MSTDEQVTKDLIQTLEDGTNGFQSAAEKLRESDRADLATRFAAHSAERAQFADELRTMPETLSSPPDMLGSYYPTERRCQSPEPHC